MVARSVVVCLFTLFGAAAHSHHRLIVPAYAYPVGSPFWSGLATIARQCPTIVVMNPSNGPGATIDPHYTFWNGVVRASGGLVIGYVHTTYGLRDVGAVLADIDQFNSFYVLDGVFVDEMSTDPATVFYYQQIHDHVKALGGQKLVVGNPGTTPGEPFVTTADILVTFEGSSKSYSTYSPALWTASYPDTRFAAIIYGQNSRVGMVHDLSRAFSQNFGNVFITADSLPNPYDELPEYIRDEVKRCLLGSKK